jgi:polygalacturonase
MPRRFWLVGVAGAMACAPLGCGSNTSPAPDVSDQSSSGSGAGGSGNGGNPNGNGSSGSGSSGNGGNSSGSESAGAGSSSSSSSGSAGSSGSVGGSSSGSAGGSSGNAGGGSSGGNGSSGVDGSMGGSGGTGGTCGAGDANLPAEPTIPSACATLQATLNVAADGVPSEASMDTVRIQAALNACASGQAVKLAANGASNAFITAPLTVPSGVTLWVDTGTTLYGTRSVAAYGSASALITVTGAKSGIVGDGVIDGQGGEPNIGSSTSFWDANGNGGTSPALIYASSATNFTLYRITLHNSPKFHVKLNANGFIVWGITIKTPSKSTNSAGTALTPSGAHNTDGIDPGEVASNGYIVCNKISDGDDHIAIKGGTSVTHLVIAHNHFMAGHGMSIGSETNGGVSGVNVYDLSIDGTNSGLGGGSSNGIRIKSDSSAGGLVTNITYSDVCVRDLANPIVVDPRYSSATGSSIPTFSGIVIRNFHALGTTVKPTITLDGYDSSHVTGITLDNVVIDDSPTMKATYADVSLGPGSVNFTPSGTAVTVTNGVSGSSTPNACSGKWVTF